MESKIKRKKEKIKKLDIKKNLLKMIFFRNTYNYIKERKKRFGRRERKKDRKKKEK